MSLAVPFPNPRDFYSSTTNADLIQPGLGPLQPNLDEMEIDLDWLNTMNTGQQQPQLQQPQSMASSVHHDQKPDLLSAIVTATTASSFQSVVAPVTYKQEQTILTSVQPQQPLQASIIELQPPVATNNQVEATLVHPRYRGGGKQRSMMAHNQQQQQSVMPYPASGYTSGHVTSVSAKTKSPKHRFLQQRHLTYSNNEPTNELNPVSSQRSANSELVQLLTSPKTTHATSTPVTDPRGPILTTLMPPVTPAPPSVLDNGRHLVPTPQQPTLLVIGIPPPLPTDYQPDHLATDYRTNGNGTHPDTHPNADHRRSVHTHAEQNRRTSLKHGFEELRSLIPSLKDVSTSSHKISKAALLVKGGDQICHIKSQCQALTSEAVQLKAAIEALEMDVSAIQGGLPGLKLGQDMSNNASEGNISVKLRQKKVSEDQTQMISAFSNHVSNATGLNWKYWAFSRLMKPVFETYANAVAGAASQGEMDRSINRWLEDECSLDQLRQSAVTSLKSICTQTNVLSDPRRLPHEALELARKSAAMNISLKVEKYTTPN